MAEENEETQETKETTTVDELLAQMEELKKNSVSKEDYDKVKADNSRLVKQIAEERPAIKEESQEVSEPTVEQKLERIKQNSEKIMEGGLSGYEYAKLLIENEDLEKELGYDPFPITDEQSAQRKDKNEKVSDLLRKCLKDCNGDERMFNNLMNSNTRSN